MGIRSTNPTQSFGDEQNVRSVGNPFSAFNDFFSGTGRDAAKPPHPGGPMVATSSGGAEFKVPTALAVPGGGGYVYHIFTDTSTPATFEVEYGTSINVLMVGGGGAGGESIEIKEGAIYADGKLRDEVPAFVKNANKDGDYEGYLNLKLLAKGQELHLPEDKFIALGDNSDNSLDSRSWGFVPDRSVIGKAVFIYYPFTQRWGVAE